METDLFGHPVLDQSLPRPTQEKKKHKIVPNGYAARPGSGPKGETCKTCEFAVKSQGGRRYYWKCKKLGVMNWTHGPGTDIRLKSPACRFWQLHKLTPFVTQTA